MSLLAMDTSSLFDPFEFPSEIDIDIEPPKPQPKFREKLEIKTLRHQDHHLKVCSVPAIGHWPMWFVVSLLYATGGRSSTSPESRLDRLSKFDSKVVVVPKLLL